jgi:hypothetical protein
MFRSSAAPRAGYRRPSPVARRQGLNQRDPGAASGQYAGDSAGVRPSLRS